jgi:hypothetical protein
MSQEDLFGIAPPNTTVHRRQARNEKTRLRRVSDPEFRESERQRLAIYDEANREKRRAANARWRARNPEKVKEKSRRQYWANPQKAKDSQRRWAEKNPGAAKAAVERYKSKRRAGYLLSCARTRAKQRGMEFNLTEKWIEERLSQGCELSGLSFDLGDRVTLEGRARALKKLRGPSIDRRDSSKGYTQDNCRLICVALNIGLQDFGWESVVDIWRAAVARYDSNTNNGA